MSRLHTPQGSKMSLLWAAGEGDADGEEALPFVRRFGVQDASGGRGATRPKEGAKGHCLRRLREAGLVVSALFQGLRFSPCALCALCVK
jgi:hypothetical protein